MDQTQREAKFRQISPMMKRRGFSDERIWEIIFKKEEEAKENIELDLLISDNKERKDATVLMAKYLEDYSITTVSDKSDVANLIYLQILNKRLQKQFEEISEKTKNKAFPLKVLDSLHKNHDAIAELKAKLGIRKDDPSQSSDAFKVIEQLKKKVKSWHEQNQGSRTLSCPSCGQMVLLKIKMDVWEAQKHPFFKDISFYNIRIPF